MRMVYTYIRALSFDVVAGAVICNLFLAQLFEVQLPVSAIIALALTVWIIYTTDHLWDAHKIETSASTFRHRFHQKNFKALRAGALVALLLLTATCFFLPLAILRIGLLVGSLVIIYFAAIRTARLTFLKEISIAIIYTLGIFLAPLALSATGYGFAPLLFAQFALLAVINLLEFSYFEMDHDQQQRFKSAALYLGAQKTLSVINLCLYIIGFLIIVTAVIWYGNAMILASQSVVAVMTLALTLIIKVPEYFQQAERFRILGDAVFLVPVILLWL